MTHKGDALVDEKKYCAFISYRHQSPDQEIAKALHTAVETYGIPASVKKKTGMTLTEYRSSVIYPSE